MLTKHMLFLSLCAFFSANANAAQVIPSADDQGSPQVKAWSRARLQEAVASFKQSGLKRLDSPKFWGDATVYQIQVDRFNNGDRRNDDKNVEPHQLKEISEGRTPGILDYRHGGDLRGIIQRLDYIKDLGTNTLWITPIFKHNGSYHGYCTTDFTQVDPGFGSNEELRELVAKAHGRGIRVVLDIVVNHMCDNKTFYKKSADHYRCSDDLNANNWSGRPGGSSAQGELAFSQDFFPALKSQHFFNRCGANSTEDMQGTGAAAVYGDFVATMFDFDTRNHDFQEIFTDIHKYWIAYADIDGYRMDAVKHVSEDFIAYFSTHVRQYARTLGKDNFYVVGEVAGPSDWIGRRLGKMYSNPQNPGDHGSVPATLTNRLYVLKDVYLNNPSAPYPGLSGAYDFAHGGIALDVLHNRQSPARLEQHFGSTYFNDIAAQNDYRLSWTLLEIHDWPRFASHHPGSMEKSALGLAYLATAEGSPIIYYGQEQGFNGDCHFDSIRAGGAEEHIKRECKGHSHALYRQDMFMSGMARLGSTVPAINQLAAIDAQAASDSHSSDQWQEDPFLKRDHMVYQTARKLLRLRASCNGLRYGRTAFRWVDHSTQGVLAFSRIDPTSGDEVLVILNTAWQARALPDMRISDTRASSRWINLLNTRDNAYVHASGVVNFTGLTIPANGVMVFVPENNIGPLDQNADVYTCAR